MTNIRYNARLVCELVHLKLISKRFYELQTQWTSVGDSTHAEEKTRPPFFRSGASCEVCHAWCVTFRWKSAMVAGSCQPLANVKGWSQTSFAPRHATWDGQLFSLTEIRGEQNPNKHLKLERIDR